MKKATPMRTTAMGIAIETPSSASESPLLPGPEGGSGGDGGGEDGGREGRGGGGEGGRSCPAGKRGGDGGGAVTASLTTVTDEVSTDSTSGLNSSATSAKIMLVKSSMVNDCAAFKPAVSAAAS